MNGKRWAALGIAGVIFAFSIITSLVSIAFTTDVEELFGQFLGEGKAPYVEEYIEDGNIAKKIAVLEVSGTIQDTGDADSLFQQLVITILPLWKSWIT